MRLVLLAAAACSGISSLRAASGTWTNAAGGSWASAINWAGETIPGGTDSIADFSTLNPTADATVSLDGPRTISGLVFGDTTPSHSWILTTGSGGPLTLDAGGGQPAITVNNQTATFSVILAGTSGMVKQGTGSLTLSGANTYSGAITVNAGTVNANHNASFGTSTVSIGAAGAVVTGNVLSNVFTGTGSLTFNTAASTLAPTAATFLNGFSGTLNVNSTGAGKLTLGTAGQNIGSGSTVNIGSGGTLFMNVASAATISGVTFNLSGSGNTENLGALRFENINIGATSSVNLVTNTALGCNNSTTFTVATSISGNGTGFSKVGGGTLLLSAANSFTGGVSILGGTLNLSHALALQNNTLTTTSALGNSGLVLSSSVAGNTFSLGCIAGNGNLLLQNSSNAAVNLTAGGNNADTTYAGALNGTGSFTKIGSGTLTLAGIGSTMTGMATVGTGTLRIKGPATFPAGLQIMPIGDSITFGFNGTNAGYRGLLYNLLKDGAPGLFYVGSSVQGNVTTTTNPLPADQRHNEGHGSYTINDINNNLDGLDSATFNQFGGADRDPNGGHWFDGIATGPNARPAVYPDIITLMIGTNNAADSDATFRTSLRALITKITTQRPAAKLIVAQITPSNRANTVSHNAVIVSEVAAFQAEGKSVSLVDMYTNFPAGGLTGDGVHPNDTGFAFMAGQWYNAITAVAATGRGPSSALSPSSPLAVATGATLDLDGAQVAVGALSGGGMVALGNGGELTTRNTTNTTSTFSGSITGAGGLTKIGGGTLVLSGTNHWSGKTTVKAGMLRISGTLTNSGTLEVLAGGTLDSTGGTIDGGTIRIRQGGVLQGTGTVNATIINESMAAPLLIMPLGDSITAGGGVGLAGNQSGYRDRLFTRLKEANVPFQFTGTTNIYASQPLIDAGSEFHNGYGSQTLKNLYDNLDKSTGLTGGASNNGGFWLTGGGSTGRAAVFPDVVLLMGGTNDADYSDGGGLATMQTNLHNLLTWFSTNRPNATVIVGLPIPWNKPGDPNLAATDKQVTDYNTWVVNTELKLPQFSKYRAAAMNALFRKQDGTVNTDLYSTDGIHPNNAGYAVIGEAWFGALQSLGITPKWQGDGTANVWSTGGPANFTGISGSTFAFSQGATVYFDDSGSKTPAVSLGGSLAPGAVTVNAASDYTFGGTGSLDGTMSLTKSGAGVLTLATDNGFTGGTIINAGSVQVGDGGTAGSLGTGAVVNNATLAFNHGDTITVGNLISGSGGIQQTGGGTTILTGANTYSGPTTVTSGTLQIGNGGTAGSLGGGAVTNHGNLAFNRSDDPAVYTSISGTGSFTKTGSGTVTLAAPQSYTGSTIISGGTLRLQGRPSFVTNGLLYRLSADSATGYTLNANGTNVDTFTDLSGNNRNFTSGGTTNGPTVVTGAGGINGMGVLRFSGAGTVNKLTLTGSTSPKMLFIVNRPAATQNTLAGIWGQNGVDSGIRMNTAAAWQYAGGNGNDFANASNGSMWINGVAVGTTANGSFLSGGAHVLSVANPNAGTYAATGLGGYFTASNRSFTGDVAEVLAYGAVLSEADRRAVESYLNFKWFGANTAFPVLSSATAVNITQSGAALDLAGFNQTVASLSGVPGSRVYLGGGTLTTGDATNTTFSGSITDAGGSGGGTGGSIIKNGSGTFTLAGSSGYSGPTRIQSGVLRVSGQITSAGTIDILDGAVLELASGTLTVGIIHVHAGGTLRGTGTIHATVVNDGTILSGMGESLAFSGSVTNNQLLQLTGGSALQVSGGIVNQGTVDIITGSQTLPDGLVNNGIILNAGSVKVSSISTSVGNLSVTVQSRIGHTYQLQVSQNLGGDSWQNVGIPQAGTGALLDLVDPAGTTAPKGFYRVQVGP